MNPQDPLAELRDIHLPDAVSLWPPAPGWWLIGLLLLSALVLVAYQLWRRHQRRAYRRGGDAELQALYASWQKTRDTQVFLQNLNALLKRVALRSFPATDVAALSGASWTLFLDQNYPGSDTPVFAGSALEFGPYAPSVADVDVTLLHEVCQRWVLKHREASSA
jgi:hypothetical protein